MYVNVWAALRRNRSVNAAIIPFLMEGLLDAIRNQCKILVKMPQVKRTYTYSKCVQWHKISQNGVLQSQVSSLRVSLQAVELTRNECVYHDGVKVSTDERLFFTNRNRRHPWDVVDAAVLRDGSLLNNNNKFSIYENKSFPRVWNMSSWPMDDTLIIQ